MEVYAMQLRKTVLLAGLMAAALSTTASAAVVASAMTPLNVRSGPGPQYPVIGAIPANGKATIIGCIQDSLWCQVSAGGKQAWAYSKYLTATLSGRSLVVSEGLTQFPPATYQAPVATVGSAAPSPVITGTLVDRPVSAAPLVIAPPDTVRDYVVEHPLQPVYLNGEVVIGSGLPPDVALAPVPGYQYQYAYVNGVPVLVEPQTREVAYVYQ
jgi:uncharacterized protein YraI